MKISAIVKITGNEIEVNFVKPDSMLYLAARMQIAFQGGLDDAFSGLVDAMRLTVEAMVSSRNAFIHSRMRDIDIPLYDEDKYD